MHLTAFEEQVVEVDDQGQLKPKEHAICVHVGRVIRVSDGMGLNLYWHAEEGRPWNDLLRWADTEED